MPSILFKPLPCFAAGFLLAGLAWAGALAYVRNKPVPNAIFTQSIVEPKLKAADTAPADSPTLYLTGGSNVLFGIDSVQFTASSELNSVNFGCAAGMGPELILYLLKPRLKRGDIVAMFWEYGHYTFTRSGEVNLTYLNLVFGPQSDFRHTLPFLDRARLALSLPGSHLRDATFLALNPYANSEIYRCAWDIDALGNARINEGRKVSREKLLEQPNELLLRPLNITSDSRTIFTDFIHDCRENGIAVIASWPNLHFHPNYAENPIVSANLARIKAFWNDLEVPVAGEWKEACFEARHAYDTPYHPNAKGRALRTSRLVETLTPLLSDPGAFAVPPVP